MEITGTIRIIGDTQVVGNNGFTKRLIVIDTDEQYSQPIPIDFVKDKCSILDNYYPGQKVKVSINLRGNEYNDKFYCSIQGWRIESIDAHQQQQPQSVVDQYQNRQQTQTSPQQVQQNNNQAPDDDLPF